MTSNLYTKTVKAGERVFSEGEFGNIAYVIESGMVEISALEKGKSVGLGLLSPGELFGEMALIDDSPRTASATAVEETILTVVSREQLMERLDNTEPMLRMLIRVIIARYRSGISQTRDLDINSQLNSPLPYDTVSNETQTLAMGKFRQENDLRLALERNELLIVFQPLVDMRTGKWAGFEALTRWNHPQKGPISPADFIALAEETTLISPIGLHVLKGACEGMIAIQNERKKIAPDLPPLFIGVNVSYKQIHDPAFIEHIAAIVHDTGLPPATLKLEITESMEVDYEGLVKWVDHCKQLGFTVAIDDFGTGFSSMEHLLELNVDTLKIDQAFIKSMEENPKAKKLVKGMVELSKSLGYSIVAEGLETREQVIALRGLKVDYGQGYYIGKPRSLEHVLERIRKGA